MEELPKKRRGRKPKDKSDAEPPAKKKRGRKKKCEVDTGNGVGLMANLSHMDIAENKVIITGNSDNKNYENISFGCGIVIKKKRKPSVTLQDFKEGLLKEEDDSCLIEFTEKPEELDPRESINLANILTSSAKTEHIRYEKKPNIVYKRPGKRKVRVLMKTGATKYEIPTTTDVWCWWCCHPFDGPPCFVPTKYDPLRGRFLITGNFCSWNCAKSYILDENLGVHRTSDLHNFTLMLKRMKLPYRVKKAPRKECLKRFGGCMDIETYRESAYTDTVYSIQTNIIEYDDSINIIGD